MAEDKGKGCGKGYVFQFIHRFISVVVKYTKRWRDYFKLKERSVYYAILGSSAIMTGMLVLILVCCCRKRASDPRKSKVSFYKV